MRSAIATALVLFGCAAADAGPIAPNSEPAPPPTPRAPVVAEPSSGWPSASSDAPALTRADFERVAAERDRLEHGGSSCVTPNATRTGDAQPDLRLEITGPRTMAATDFPELKGTIRNVSKRAHAIVLPGDGSDAGWRDPVISFTAFIDEGDGCWKPMPRAAVGRCGLFDPDWSDEIVRVKAGTSRALDPLWAWPHFEWKKGKVRLFVHYTWTGGTAEKGRSAGTRSIDPGAMAKEKPFELVSNALELEITA